MNPLISLTKKELIVLCVIVVFVLLLVFLPPLVGYFSAKPGFSYMHTAYPIYQDSNSYLSWIRQAAEGHLLFQIKYTSEVHPRIFFHPVFLAMGLVVGLLHVPLFVVWYAVQALAVIVFVFSLYLFIGYFIDGPGWRFWTLAVALFGGGVGWLTFIDNRLFPLAMRPVDVNLPEATMFGSLQWPFIFVISLSLIFWIFMLLLRAHELKRWSLLYWAGALGFLLNSIHPYDLVTIFGITAAYFLFNKLWQQWRYVLVFFVVTGLPTLYQLWVLTDPVFRAHSQFPMLSAHPLSYVYGFGLLVLLTGFGIWLVIKNKITRSYFLIIWIIVSTALLYAPLTFQRRLVAGLIVPCVILSVMFVRWLIEARLRLSFLQQNAVMAALVVVLSLTTIVSFTLQLLSLRGDNLPYYLPQGTVAGFRWLEKRTPRQAVVLSSWELGSFIPVWAGNTAFIGHGAQTINVWEKTKQVTDFFNGTMPPDQQKNFLEKNTVQYVMYTSYESSIYHDDQWGDGLLEAGIIEPVYTDSAATIYKVRL